MSKDAQKMSEDVKKKKTAEDITDEEEINKDAETETDSENNSGEETSAAEEDTSSKDSKSSEKTEEDEAMETKYLRLMADFQNFKRRTANEKSDIYARANEKIVSQLLDVLDNFERAIAHKEDDCKAFAEGMELIFKQFLDVLDKAGAKEIPADNEAFDPNFHNAVMMEDTDKVESGNISEVLQKGYTLNGKVVRPSMVKVAK